jgi:hypothetical protein
MNRIEKTYRYRSGDMERQQRRQSNYFPLFQKVEPLEIRGFDP